MSSEFALSNLSNLNGVEQKINIPCVMKNSSSCDSVSNSSRGRRKSFSRSRNHHVPQRVYSNEGKRGRALSPLRFIAKVGAVTSREETPFIGDRVYDGQRERERMKKARLSTSWCIARGVYETQARARKIATARAIDRYRVTNESRSKRTISLSLSLFFFRAERVSLRENINITRSR